MKTVSNWIRQHALHVCGIHRQHTRQEISEHVKERTERVFELIRCRVAVGFLRYESNRGRAPNYLAWLEQSLAEYKATRNIDALLDVAFYAMAEFQDPSLEGTFYRTEKTEERSEL